VSMQSSDGKKRIEYDTELNEIKLFPSLANRPSLLLTDTLTDRQTKLKT